MRQDSQDELLSLAGARSQANPGAKLLAAARELFNEQGYSTAGINEIISRSNTSKKSFYAYYPSKKDLGQAYLLAEEEEFGAHLTMLFSRSRGRYSHFVRLWMASLKNKAATGTYNGCPFANAAAHAPGEFRPLLTEIMDRLAAQLTDFLTSCDLKMRPAPARAYAKIILMKYQGGVQMWRLTRDASYFAILQKELL